MKLFRPYILLVVLSLLSLKGAYASSKWVERGSDETIEITLKPIFVFEKGIDKRKFWRLVNSVKRVYPLAKVGREKMDKVEANLATFSTMREQREYIRGVYNEMKAEYSPVLRKMSYTDGRILIRLIDRETDYTAYEVLDEFKGSLTATLWQGVGKIFGHDLKTEYGSAEEDKMIEKIIRYYEAGLL